MADKELMPIEQTLPRNLFILPLVGNPIFPGLFTPLVVESKEDIEIVTQAMNHGGDLGLILVKDESKSDYEADNLYPVGTIAKIIKRIKLPDGGMNIFISPIKRFQVKDFHFNGKFIVAEVDYLDDIEDNPTELKAWTRQLITETKKLRKATLFLPKRCALIWLISIKLVKWPTLLQVLSILIVVSNNVF